MIDIENIVFDTVATSLRVDRPDMFLAGGQRQLVPEKLPAAVGREIDNSTYLRSLDSSGIEKHASVSYEWQVFSKSKSECKAILAIIDTEMWKLGFVRTSSSPMEVPNADPSIYRMIARYRAVVSKDKTIYRK